VIDPNSTQRATVLPNAPLSCAIFSDRNRINNNSNNSKRQEFANRDETITMDEPVQDVDNRASHDFPDAIGRMRTFRRVGKR